MKAMGMQVSRMLGFSGCNFETTIAPLTPSLSSTYDDATVLWDRVHASLARASKLLLRGKKPMRPFWGAHQRFFRGLCVALKSDAAIATAKSALAKGCSVVIGLQSTGEAAFSALVRGTDIMHRGKVVAGAKGNAPGEMVWRGAIPSALKLSLLGFLSDNFPTTMEEGAVDPQSGVPIANAVRDDAEARCVAMRDELLRAARGIDLPPNPLDALLDALGGVENVAEMTGRTHRVVRGIGAGRYEFVSRVSGAGVRSEGTGGAGAAHSAVAAPARRRALGLSMTKDVLAQNDLNVHEKNLFMSGAKTVALISDAASTGISLHADRRCASSGRRRVHITLELPWSADKAIQQLGRSHRSNAMSAPRYVLLVADVGGERRFVAAVARRLEALGALTRGDRRAASGQDLSAFNLDSQYGREALGALYDAIERGKAPLSAALVGVVLAAVAAVGVQGGSSSSSSSIVEGVKVRPDSRASGSAAGAASSPSGAPPAEERSSAEKTAASEAAARRALVDALLAMGIMVERSHMVDTSETFLAAVQVPIGLQVGSTWWIDVIDPLTLCQRQAIAIVPIGSKGGDFVSVPVVRQHEKKVVELADAKLRRDMNRFLNRLLGATLAQQRALFAAFEFQLAQTVRLAKEAGEYLEGAGDLKFEDAVEVSLGTVETTRGTASSANAVQSQMSWDQTLTVPDKRSGAELFEDPRTGATATLRALLTDRGISFKSALSKLRAAAQCHVGATVATAWGYATITRWLDSDPTMQHTPDAKDAAVDSCDSSVSNSSGGGLRTYTADGVAFDNALAGNGVCEVTWEAGSLGSLAFAYGGAFLSYDGVTNYNYCATRQQRRSRVAAAAAAAAVAGSDRDGDRHGEDENLGESGEDSMDDFIVGDDEVEFEFDGAGGGDDDGGEDDDGSARSPTRSPARSPFRSPLRRRSDEATTETKKEKQKQKKKKKQKAVVLSAFERRLERRRTHASGFYVGTASPAFGRKRAVVIAVELSYAAAKAAAGKDTAGDAGAWYTVMRPGTGEAGRPMRRSELLRKYARYRSDCGGVVLREHALRNQSKRKRNAVADEGDVTPLTLWSAAYNEADRHTGSGRRHNHVVLVCGCVLKVRAMCVV